MNHLSFHPEIFKTNDIRGIYKKDFHRDFVKALGVSLVHFTRKKLKNLSPRPFHPSSGILKFSLGYDARLSSREIARTLQNTLQSQGVRVYHLGRVSTPFCFFSQWFYKNIELSIMITASHNPPQYNGFKFLFKGLNVCGADLLHLKKQLINFDFHSLKQKPKTFKKKLPSKKTRSFKTRLTEAYLNFFKKEFASLKNQKCFVPVIDCGNGSSGPMAQKVFKALNLKALWLFVRPDGRFPHHAPDPSKKQNLKALCSEVKNQAEEVFGVAFDGDGDRLVVTDETGKIIPGDELMAIFLNHLSLKRKKAPVVVDVKCADWFFDFLQKKHLNYILSASGHSLVRTTTLKVKAFFGGELSGHFFFCDRPLPLDDGVYNLLRLIQIMHLKQKSLKNLRPFKPKTYETDEIRKPIANIKSAHQALSRLKKHYKNTKKTTCLPLDGLRVSRKGAWALARISGTAKEWTLRFGGKNPLSLKTLKKNFYRILFKSNI